MIDYEKSNILLGKESSEYLLILVYNFTYPNSTDFSDGNWLNTRIKIKVGGFTADYEALLSNVDFFYFKNDLEKLYTKLDGTAKFNCIEEYLQIKIKGDGLGRFAADCIAIDKPGYGHELKFRIEFDQTEILNMVKMINSLLDEFPIKDIEQIERY